ncbi:MAG: PQQ-like beta-propeller repeat protein [Bdellovibrionales bacterium]|nr:PQQ-like beta-propeller repeat protein [Bdellovibrionales bacterium]
MRPLHISFDDKSRCLFASTSRGTILKFDADLKQLATSQPGYNLNNLYVMIIDESFIYARDISGRLARWHKDTLVLDTVIDLTNWSDPNEESLPNVSHGLFLHNGYLYVAMPQGKIGKFRQDDLSFIGLSEYLPKALIESFDFTGPQGHFAVDFSGYVYAGDIDQMMKPVSRVATGACHQILYDKKFDRYWITDDYHCGLALFSAHDPQNIQRVPLTRDDVEWMSFNHGQSQILVACFDRFIYRLSNEREPKILGKFGPYKYQVNHVEWTSHGIYALTESGEIYLTDPATGEIKQGPTGTNAVWDIQPVPGSRGQFLVAFEDGFVRRMNIEGENIKTESECNLGMGMVRRIISGDDGGAFVLTVAGQVARLDRNFSILWLHESQPLLRDFIRRAGKILFCTEQGELTCLDEGTGALLWRRNFDMPLWSVTADPLGQFYWVAARLCEMGDQGQESTARPADVVVGDLATGIELRRESAYGNIKRFKWLDDQHMLINGNGRVATSVVRASDFSVVRCWRDWQLNTCEGTLVHNSRLYTTTYGYQLNTFEFAGEILESAFPFEDYATSLAAVDDKHIVAGGRGAYLSVFSVHEGLPVLAATKRF